VDVRNLRELCAKHERAQLCHARQERRNHGPLFERTIPGLANHVDRSRGQWLAHQRALHGPALLATTGTYAWRWEHR
jgi:hypothetical protein